MHTSRPILVTAAVLAGLGVTAIPTGSAQDSDPNALVAPWIDDETTIDGVLADSSWASGGHQQLHMEHTGSGGAQFVQAYHHHNATDLFLGFFLDEGDGIAVQIDPSHSTDADGRFVDAFRVTPDGTLTDLDWNTETHTFQADDVTEGCGQDGAAAVSTGPDGHVYEIRRPLLADGCDAFIPHGDTVGIRVVLDTADGAFHWPTGSAFEQDPDVVVGGSTRSVLSTWGDLTTLGRFGDTSQGIPAAPPLLPGDPGLETDVAPGPDRGPVNPRPPDGGGAYDATERTPGPGLVLLLLSGFGALVALAVWGRLSS